jgi:hypothetical protein
MLTRRLTLGERAEIAFDWFIRFMMAAIVVTTVWALWRG